MGMIRIIVGGSFEHEDAVFTAMEGGHAQAVADAIAFLSRQVLPKAIRQDHQLQHEGAFPANRFGIKGKV